MASSLPAITGQGVEDSTIAGNGAAVALLRSFLEHFLRANRALATVDDKNEDGALVELAEDDYAVSCLPCVYSGTSLRRGALRTMRSQGVDRDKCADTTGHSTMVPGGHSGGTVPIKSALHSYDVIDPNDVVHGTMALCGWKPPIGILTHAPKVATLEALEGTVPMASLEHLARNLFRLDSTVTPSLQPGKRLAPLVRTMLAHCIMYFTQVLDTYGG